VVTERQNRGVGDWPEEGIFGKRRTVPRNKELLATRASLLERLKATSADESWSQFFKLYWKLIYNTASRYGLSDCEAQEVVQETMLTVSKKIPSFDYDPNKGRFKGWLMALTRSRILEQLRTRKAMLSMENAGEVLDSFSFQELWEQEWKDNLVNVAIERVRKQITTRAFQIYSYCVLQDHGAQKAASVLKISLPAVYLTTHKVNRMLRKEIKKMSTEAAQE
jgi:RNA polymerase sigma factor (sigma-70 family)